MNSREMSLGKVSVVQMAMAVVSQWSKVEPRAAWDFGMPPVILSMGSLREVSQYLGEGEVHVRPGDAYLWPMTPVLMTMVESEAPVTWSVWRDMAAASSRPPLPVTAFAQPELMTTLRTRLPVRASRSRLKVTGAAWNLFLVKTAAAEQGASEVMRARSGLVVLAGLTPTLMAATRKPMGNVPVLGTYLSFLAGISSPCVA